MQIKGIQKQVRKNLGKVIREKRQYLKFSQDKLSKKAYITRTYLSLIENGKRFPSWETLEKIANLLSTEPSSIIKDANLAKYDKDFELIYLLSKVIEKGDKYKIEQVSNLIKSFS